MSSVLEGKQVAHDGLAEKLNFSKSLQAVTNKIRSAMFSRMKTDMKALVEYEFEF